MPTSNERKMLSSNEALKELTSFYGTFKMAAIENQIFGHNLGSSIAGVTMLMSIPMFFGMRNPIVPIENVYVW